MTTEHQWHDRFWLLFKYALIAFATAFLIRAFLLIPVPVSGNSMEGTLQQGDMVIIEKISPIRRFDVVVFQMPDGSTYIKRVIGMPGDSVKYEADQLYINDEPVEEPFLAKNRNNDHETASYTNDFDLESLLGVEKLGKDSYFVIGDNRRASKDSRSFGPISGDAILGNARFVYYPFSHIRFI